jgi:CRP-like cAMP-binding protein
MGVREAWTYSRRDGARIWVADPETESSFRAADQSLVLPGLGRHDLQQLLGDSPRLATSWRSRQLARRVARTILAR